MSAVAAPVRYTPEDLLTMPDGNRYELENGLLVEREMSTLCSLVAGIVHALFHTYCHKTRAGWPFPEGHTYQCFSDDPDRVRKADVSFIRWDRLPKAQLARRGHCRVVPDVAVEVLSPSDTVYEVDAKVQLWLSAGVQRVWVINPEQRTLRIYRANGSDSNFRENDGVSGEEIMPGFQCKVADFFALPAGPANGE